MSSNDDFHEKPFPEQTKTKLRLYSDYTKEWFPVFLNWKSVSRKKINIFDFFAGPGTDSEGSKGSPLLIIDEIKKYLEEIRTRSVQVTLYFNEYDNEKYDKLWSVVENQRVECEPCKIIVTKEDFNDIYKHYYPIISDSDTANLVFLDQYGIRYITPEVFQGLISCNATDFLFFISSSTIKRFADVPSISKYIDISREEIDEVQYYHIHRVVLEYYRNLVPESKKYYLAPFSLIKGSNIYGVIFGTGDFLGIEKFLKTAWKIDPVTGEANFDIEQRNIDSGQLDLFIEEPDKSNKHRLFERDLENGIQNCNLKTNEDVYIFTINRGFLPKHTNDVISRLKNEGVLARKHYYINYTNVKKGNIVKLEVL